MTRQNWNNTQDLNELSFETRTLSLEFGETSLFYIGHSKGCREKKTIYFSRNITITIFLHANVLANSVRLADKLSSPKLFHECEARAVDFLCFLRQKVSERARARLVSPAKNRTR